MEAMRGDEERIVRAFCQWLEGQGWTIRREVKFIDVVAERGDERLFAEAKRRTAAIGLDVDTLYGQLLRRMPEEEVGRARFGVVVPVEGMSAAVSKRVRQLLRIEIFAVHEDGSVEKIA
jgi:hypothetical protein